MRVCKCVDAAFNGSASFVLFDLFDKKWNFKTESANGGKFYTSIICMYTTVQMYPDTGLLLTRRNFSKRL